MPLLITGQTIDSSFVAGRYEVRAFLGEGGFGEVYRIFDRAEDVERALKIISPRAMLSDPDAQRWLEREAKAALAVMHPNAVHVFEYSATTLSGNVLPFIVMEYLPGGDLASLIAQRRRENNRLFDIRELLSYMEQLSSGLAAINQQIIHRDMKPQNVFFADGTLKIGDFGMAKYVEDATRTLTFKGGGTPLYMAPESYNLETATVATDIYSLGVMFYELVTLQVPFSSRDLFHLRDQHLFAPIPRARQLNPDLPELVEAIIIKMMAKTPNQRYQDATDITRLLKSEHERLVAKNESGEAGEQSVVDRFKGAVRSKILREVEAETKSIMEKQKLQKQMKIREIQQHALVEALGRSVSYVNRLLSDNGLTDQVELEGKPVEFLPEFGIRVEEFFPGTKVRVRFLHAGAVLHISIWQKDAFLNERDALKRGWVAVGSWQQWSGQTGKQSGVALRLETDAEDNLGKWMWAHISNIKEFNQFSSLEWDRVGHFLKLCDNGVIESNWTEVTDATIDQWIFQLADQE